MTTHLDDDVLVRHLDREDGPAERVEVTRHLESCVRCADRLAGLSRAGAAFSAALRAGDVAPPRVPRAAPRWGLRAAAAVVFVAGIAGAVRPVRAWILERAEALWVAVTGPREPAPPSPAPGRPRSASVAFVPVGDELTLEVTTPQAGGGLRLETAAGDTAVVRVEDGTGAEDFLVLPSRLRIVNPPGSAARYLLLVPARLARVRVVVGGARPWDYVPGGGPVEVPLGSR